MAIARVRPISIAAPVCRRFAPSPRARGTNLGRSIGQSEQPVPMVRALRHIVHGNGTVAEAQEVFDSVTAGNGRVAPVPA